MPATERRLQIRGLDIAVLEWAAEGVPVIAVHGWLDNAASFVPLARFLNGVHLVVPDVVGHGQSDHLPASANYHLADYSRWIVALADAMGWERFVLMGHSMGAAAASITAAGIPQRLAGLILLDGIGPLAFTPEQEVQRLRKLLGEGASTGAPRYFSKLESAVKVRQRMGRFPISSEAASLLVQRGTVEEGGRYRWSHDERLKGPNTHYYCREQAEGILRSVETPTLLISATEGALQGWEDFERRKACVPNLQHVILTGRHHLHMEQPAVVASCINDFLATLSRGAT